jgi:hypothetical protein
MPQSIGSQQANMDSPFGVLEFLHWNHPWNEYKYGSAADIEKAVALMKEAGVAWVRMDFLWDEIEPKEGEFNFDKYDRIVEILGKNQIDILGLLNYSATWASASKEWNCPPRDNKLFVNYALKVARHYQGKIKYWEVWNEPDSSIYWSRQDGLKSYCLLLKEVYLVLKKLDPGCKVLNGGLANGLASVNKLYDNGAGKYFDILNIHFFESPLPADAIKAVAAYPGLVYKVMSRNGDAKKKIWITEIGCPGVPKGVKTGSWWLGDNPDEGLQAEWLKSIYTELLKDRRVERVFWAFFRDCNGHWKNGIDYFGLVRWDFSKKQAFLEYKRLTQRWHKGG